MKLALDAWYELWERTDSGNGVHSEGHLEEESDYYPWHQDYLKWVRGKEARGDSG